MSSGIQLIVREWTRQRGSEGWTAEHDDTHKTGELITAAICYLRHGIAGSEKPINWPWADHWWKPCSYKRSLEKAGALIAAELDRLLRLESKITQYQKPANQKPGDLSELIERFAACPDGTTYSYLDFVFHGGEDTNRNLGSSYGVNLEIVEGFTQPVLSEVEQLKKDKAELIALCRDMRNKLYGQESKEYNAVVKILDKMEESGN